MKMEKGNRATRGAVEILTKTGDACQPKKSIASTSPGLPGTVPPDGLLPLSRYGIGIIPEVLEYLIV